MFDKCDNYIITNCYKNNLKTSSHAKCDQNITKQPTISDTLIGALFFTAVSGCKIISIHYIQNHVLQNQQCLRPFL